LTADLHPRGTSRLDARDGCGSLAAHCREDDDAGSASRKSCSVSTIGGRCDALLSDVTSSGVVLSGGSASWGSRGGSGGQVMSVPGTMEERRNAPGEIRRSI
jgi:hypothetical protein